VKSSRLISAVVCGTAASVAFATAAPAAPAVAKHPKPGAYAQTNKSGSKFLMEFTYAKGKVTDPYHYDNCVTVPFLDPPKIKVKKGTFSWTGKVTDVTKNKFKLHVDGKFVTKTKAKGNWTAEKLGKNGCTSKFNYKVKRTGPAAG
jgi:hypothetical protein